jgi:hypothetical protein
MISLFVFVHFLVGMSLMRQLTTGTVILLYHGLLHSNFRLYSVSMGSGDAQVRVSATLIAVFKSLPIETSLASPHYLCLKSELNLSVLLNTSGLETGQGVTESPF